MASQPAIMSSLIYTTVIPIFLVWPLYSSGNLYFPIPPPPMPGVWNMDKDFVVSYILYFVLHGDQRKALTILYETYFCQKTMHFLNEGVIHTNPTMWRFEQLQLWGVNKKWVEEFLSSWVKWGTNLQPLHSKNAHWVPEIVSCQQFVWLMLKSYYNNLWSIEFQNQHTAALRVVYFHIIDQYLNFFSYYFVAHILLTMCNQLGAKL